MLIDTIDTQSVELIKWSHPFRVTFWQIIIDCHHVHTVTGQSIQEYRQSSHQRLTLTGCHFCNLTLMQNDTTKQLHIIVHHSPCHIVTTGKPMVLPNSFIAFDTHKVFSLRSQVTVELSSSHFDFRILRESAGCIFYDGKSLRKHIIQCFFILFKHFFFQLVNLRKDAFTIF